MNTSHFLVILRKSKPWTSETLHYTMSFSMPSLQVVLISHFSYFLRMCITSIWTLNPHFFVVICNSHQKLLQMKKLLVIKSPNSNLSWREKKKRKKAIRLHQHEIQTKPNQLDWWKKWESVIEEKWKDGDG